MANEQLNEYIQKARQAGMRDEQIRGELIKAGWQDHQIQGTLHIKSAQPIKGKKSPILKIAVIVVAVLILGGVAYGGFYFYSNLDRTSSLTSLDEEPVLPGPEIIQNEDEDNDVVDIQDIDEVTVSTFDKLLIAKQEVDQLKLIVFDTATGEVESTRSIFLETPLGFSQHGMAGANDSVQINWKTEDVFYITRGSSEYDGSCLNADGSCTSRLYRLRKGSENPTMIHEFEVAPFQWVVNPFDDSLIFSMYETPGRFASTAELSRTVLKLNGDDGETIYRMTDSLSKPGLAELRLSQDGSMVYQIRRETGGPNFQEQTLYLQKIDSATGEISETRVYAGRTLNAGTDISPDGDHIAFFSGGQETLQLHVYQISTGDVFDVPHPTVDTSKINNLNILWSGDSTKLAFLLNSTLSYFDFEQSRFVSIDLEDPVYLFAWQPARSYFVVKTADEKMYIVDADTQSIKSIGISDETILDGVSWF